MSDQPSIVRKIVSGIQVGKSAEGGESAVYRAVASDLTVDRYGDTIDPLGWDLSSFEKSGTMFWNHLTSDLPVAKAVRVWVDGEKSETAKLMTEFRFVGVDINPLAPQIEAAVKAGVVNSLSVGFLPKESADADDRVGSGWWPPKNYKKQELLEISVVGIPANPSALIEAKAAGLDLDWMRALALRTLEELDGGGLWTPKAKLDVLRALTPARVFVPVAAPTAPAAPAPVDATQTFAGWLKDAVAESAAADRLKNTGRLD